MRRLAQALTHRTVAWAVVVITLLVIGACLLLASKVEQEDDLLAFLPADDPQVAIFHQLNKRFGSLNVAIVGLESDDVFSGAFLSKLKKLTRELEDAKGLDRVLSLTNLLDFMPDPKGGIITGALVDRVPQSSAEEAAMRKKVLSRDHAVGNLVASDGKAVLVLCFLAHGSDPKSAAATIRAITKKYHPPSKTYWGGAPFISTYIYNSTERDMRRLTPWAVLAMVVVMMLAFRDLRGTCLALLSTSFGIVISIGLMSLFDVPINLALGSMPVILFAVGSAYGIHMLARYYKLAGVGKISDEDNARAVAKTLTTTGPTVLAAGLTTVVSLLSFITMDLRPMQTFGIFTAIGVLATLILSLTFIPAVIRLARFRGRRDPGTAFGLGILRAVTLGTQRHRILVGVALGLLAAGGVILTLQVDARIELSKLFPDRSPPDLAERFLRQRFGGSQYMQIHVAGDLNESAVLREVQWIADRISLLPDVASVMQIGEALGRANEAMEGLRRIPDSKEKISLLYALTTGDASVAQLITADHRHALIHVKLASNRARRQEALLSRVERWTRRHVPQRFLLMPADATPASRARRREKVVARVLALMKKSGEGQLVDAALEGRITAHLRSSPKVASSLARSAVRDALRIFLRSEECVVELPSKTTDGDPALALATAIAALGPSSKQDALKRAAARALGKPEAAEEVDDLVVSLQTPLSEIWKRERSTLAAKALIAAAGIALPAGDAGKTLLATIATALLDLESRRLLMPADAKEGQHGVGRLSVNVSGLPVLHRSLSRSSIRNQLKSLAAAIIPVMLIMALLFRSLRTGLMVASPTLFTLFLIYGGMGLLDVHLDIGTAMLACIILGAGVDYGVHLVASWRSSRSVEEAGRLAIDRTGTAIWTNALAVAVGFFVLTMGEAKPLQNVGGLTSLAMLVAAAATFLLIPLFARRKRYGRGENELADVDVEQEGKAPAVVER